MNSYTVVFERRDVERLLMRARTAVAELDRRIDSLPRAGGNAWIAADSVLRAFGKLCTARDAQLACVYAPSAARESIVVVVPHAERSFNTRESSTGLPRIPAELRDVDLRELAATPEALVLPHWVERCALSWIRHDGTPEALLEYSCMRRVMSRMLDRTTAFEGEPRLLQSQLAEDWRPRVHVALDTVEQRELSALAPDLIENRLHGDVSVVELFTQAPFASDNVTRHHDWYVDGMPVVTGTSAIKPWMRDDAQWTN